MRHSGSAGCLRGGTGAARRGARVRARLLEFASRHPAREVQHAPRSPTVGTERRGITVIARRTDGGKMPRHCYEAGVQPLVIGDHERVLGSIPVDRLPVLPWSAATYYSRVPRSGSIGAGPARKCARKFTRPPFTARTEPSGSVISRRTTSVLRSASRPFPRW